MTLVKRWATMRLCGTQQDVDMPKRRRVGTGSKGVPSARGHIDDSGRDFPCTNGYAGMDFSFTKSEIRNPDGSIVFRLDNVEVPSSWSQVASDVLAQKYFRKAGVPAALKRVRRWREMYYPEITEWKAYNKHSTPLPR